MINIALSHCVKTSALAFPSDWEDPTGNKTWPQAKSSNFIELNISCAVHPFLWRKVDHCAFPYKFMMDQMSTDPESLLNAIFVLVHLNMKAGSKLLRIMCACHMNQIPHVCLGIFWLSVLASALYQLYEIHVLKRILFLHFQLPVNRFLWLSQCCVRMLVRKTGLSLSIEEWNPTVFWFGLEGAKNKLLRLKIHTFLV